MINVFDRFDSYAEHRHVPSHLLFKAGPEQSAPEVSITIPTFRRPALLLETVESVLAQQASDVPCEIVIISNDEDGDANQAIVDRLPRNPRYALRFYANDRNIGMFPNWNRGVELAGGRWVSVLNDDDVLRPDFLTDMMKRIRSRPEIDGLVCQTGFIDRRPQPGTNAAGGSLARTVWKQIVKRRFDADGLTRIGPRQLFFGNELSSTLGFLVKRELALSTGGFRTEDWPSADYLFYARFSAEHGLYLLDQVLADVGIGENESLRIEAMTGFMTQGDRLRRDMAPRYVPQAWLRMSPLIVATAVAETNTSWHGALDPQAVGQNLGMTLPAPSRTKLNLMRLLHRAL